MPSVESYKNHLYLKYYDPVKRYTRRRSLHLKDTQANRRTAQREAKNFHADFTPANFIRPGSLTLTLTDAKEQLAIIKNFRPKTKSIYDYAVDHLTKACGNKLVTSYNHRDYIKLLSYFRQKKLSQNSQSIYTRTLRSLFNYFVKQNLIKENIIDKVPYHEKVPRPIPIEDLRKIYAALETKEDHFHQYALIYLLANTGIRISTALALNWEDIDWHNERIIFRNIKVRGTEYTIPLVQRFKTLFIRLGKKKAGKIFPYTHNHGTRFLRRAQESLKFTNIHSIHKLKHTFISEMVKKGISLDILSEITNTSLRTLRKHYMHLDRKFIADQLQNNEVA